MDNERKRGTLSEVFEGVVYDFESLISEIAQGEHQDLLEDVHGAKSSKIQKLAQEISETPRLPSGKPPVLLIPGNMCTQLAKPSGPVIWLDPETLLFEWETLALAPGQPNLVPGDLLFPVKLYLLPLVLELMGKGYSVSYFPTDWRADYADGNLALQRILIDCCQANRKISIITHSEGGLVARGAIGAVGERMYDVLQQLILVASPNYGAWAMIEMFQGKFLDTFKYKLPYHVDDLVELIEHHRLVRTPEYVAKRLTGDSHSEPARFFQWLREGFDHYVDAFCHPLLKDLYEFKDRFFLRGLESALTKRLIFTWPGWYGMLPFREKAPQLDRLYDASQWPSHFPRPNQKLLDRALEVQKCLAMPPEPGKPGYESWHLLMGTKVETVTNVRLEGHKFEYEYSREGDGLIPLNLTEMVHATAHKPFDGVDHVELMADEQAIQTMVTILEGNSHGETA